MSQLTKLIDLFVDLSVLDDASQKLRLFILNATLNCEEKRGWRTVQLGDVMQIYSGDSIAASEKELKYTGLPDGRPYIATKDVRGWFGPLDYSNGVRIPSNISKFKVAPPGSVLICAEGGSAGKKLGFVERDVCFGNKLFCCVPNPQELLPEYVLRFFQSEAFFEKFHSEVTGIIGGISLAGFKRLEISYPIDLEEQKAILLTIGRVFDAVDVMEAQTAEAKKLKVQCSSSFLESITNRAPVNNSTASVLFDEFVDIYDGPAELEQLRNAFLELAVTGRVGTNDPAEPAITSEGLHDTRTGEALRYSPEPDRRDAPSIPPNWKWIELGKLVNSSRPISYGVIKLGADKPDGIRTLRCSDVKFRYIDATSIKAISPDVEAPFQRTRLQGGEVLINIRGTLGGVAVVPQSMAGYNIAREVAMVDPNSGIMAHYLLAVLSSPLIQREVAQNLKGIAYRGLNLGSLSKFQIPVPPLAEQGRIVRAVDAFVQQVARTESLVLSRNKAGTDLLDALIKQGEFRVPPFDGGNGRGERALASSLSAPDKNNEMTGSTNLSPPKNDGNVSLSEALLVSAIVLAFYADGGQPLGNFRLQKAVYFARRYRGDGIHNMAYLKKAAGPYNPTMKYSGGIFIAKSQNWIREAKGKYGFGHIPGPDHAASIEMAQMRGLDALAKWVVQTFKRRRDNEQWEILATVDYAVQELHLRNGKLPSPKVVIDHLEKDPDWGHKLEKLSLTEASVASAMSEARALFGGSRGH
ncbi:restriction endonuclease subunit S [Rhizobium leguminosarum]|uniref:restriction endonuclease subunit S n=1 Tax=Rhizobium leguminosarum TaxID=384 RepID=UPI001030F1ED|nr:restriction endonuclease subunit S [Rhizobium leguminosarum]TBF80813.1 hypothetical protein ELG86_01020 [Rhizobium leguminosarum]